MTLQEKLAQTPRLERIDSSIESCILILEQELIKRRVEAPDYDYYIDEMYTDLQLFKDDFNIMKGKK